MKPSCQRAACRDARAAWPNYKTSYSRQNLRRFSKHKQTWSRKGKIRKESKLLMHTRELQSVGRILRLFKITVSSTYIMYSDTFKSMSVYEHVWKAWDLGVSGAKTFTSKIIVTHLVIQKMSYSWRHAEHEFKCMQTMHIWIFGEEGWGFIKHSKTKIWLYFVM